MFFSNKIFDGSDDNSDDDSEMTMTMITSHDYQICAD